MALIQPGIDIGRYHILEQLGEGGMAVVYKAFDTHLESDVAIKILRVGGFPADSLPRILKRFQIEAKKMAQLNHTNIIKVMDYGEFEGSPFLVMPYIPGGTLKERLGKPLPWKAAIRIVIPIANALAYAHEKGLIHRDVKPSNILITQSGEPMLSDFGVAKVLESDETLDLTFTGTGVGTPEYMAPEQAAGNIIDPRVDIYALGVVLYEMLTGRVPFTADTPIAVIIKKATEPMPNPRSLIPDLPEAVEHVLFKALAKNPANRFETMEALIAAVENLNIGRSESKLDALPCMAIGEDNEKKPFDLRWLLGLVGIICVGLIIYFIFFIPYRNTIDSQDALSPSNSENLPSTELNSTDTPVSDPSQKKVIVSTMRPEEGLQVSKIPENGFVMIETSEFANWLNDAFIQPPKGKLIFNNIPFLISSGDNAIFQTQHIGLLQMPTQLTLELNINNPEKVHILLIGSGAIMDLGANFTNEIIGEIELTFSSSKVITTQIIVCKNIREGWFYENDPFTRDYCSPTSGSLWQNSWTEKQLRGNQSAYAVIDTLTIEIPQDQNLGEIKSIRIIDQKYETSLIVFGLTIETTKNN